jgi:rhodanese-related sulfurtransferase
MNKIIAALLVSTLALPLFADDSAKKEDFKLIHVADLSAAISSPQPPAIFDANNQDTRATYGVIPGATLLSNYKKYNVKKILPADKSKALVFYCANTKCMASHGAAARAIKAGYTDVSVMADGIMGWKDAGQPVSTPAKP